MRWYSLSPANYTYRVSGIWGLLCVISILEYRKSMCFPHRVMCLDAPMIRQFGWGSLPYVSNPILVPSPPARVLLRGPPSLAYTSGEHSCHILVPFRALPQAGKGSSSQGLGGDAGNRFLAFTWYVHSNPLCPGIASSIVLHFAYRTGI